MVIYPRGKERVWCAGFWRDQRVVDTWLGHRSDQSMAAVYYRLRDEEAQGSMTQIPFGAGVPSAGAG